MYASQSKRPNVADQEMQEIVDTMKKWILLQELDTIVDTWRKWISPGALTHVGH